MRQRILLLVLTFLFISSTVVFSSSMEVVKVSTPEFNEVMKKHPEMTVLDIRTPCEFNEKHVKGAINIDFLASDFADRLKELDKSLPILLYCRSGNRSGQSLVVFYELGFKKIYHLKNGIVGGWPKR